MSWSDSTATIEHILPDHLDDEWNTIFNEDEHARYVERLGNYTLLERGKNKDIGQALFSVKKEVFATSQYSLTRDLEGLDEWTSAAINKRQKELAAIATSVWRFP